MLPESLLKRDLIKLACLAATLAGAIGIFIVTPALSTPTVLSIVIAMLLSPWSRWENVAAGRARYRSVRSFLRSAALWRFWPGGNPIGTGGVDVVPRDCSGAFPHRDRKASRIRNFDEIPLPLPAIHPSHGYASGLRTKYRPMVRRKRSFARRLDSDLVVHRSTAHLRDAQ